MTSFLELDTKARAVQQGLEVINTERDAAKKARSRVRRQKRPNRITTVLGDPDSQNSIVIDPNTFSRRVKRLEAKEREIFVDGVFGAPVVVKDEIPEVDAQVYSTLRGANNLAKPLARQIANTYNQGLYDGNPHRTSIALSNAKQLIGKA